MGVCDRERAFEKLFKENYSPLYYNALYIVHDSEVARDVVNDVFTRAWEDFSYSHNRYGASYLRQCVYNRCLDHLKHSKVESAYVKFFLDMSRHSIEWDSDKQEEYLELIDRVMERMPARTRFVMDQCFYEGHTYKEVASILGISVSGVKQHVMKALRLLRESFSLEYAERRITKRRL